MTLPLPPVMCGPCYDGLCETLGCVMPGLCTCTCRVALSREREQHRERPPLVRIHDEQCDMGEDCSCTVSGQHAYGLPVTTHPDIPPHLAYVTSLPVELDPDRPLREQPDWYALLQEAAAEIRAGSPVFRPDAVAIVTDTDA